LSFGKGIIQNKKSVKVKQTDINGIRSHEQPHRGMISQGIFNNSNKGHFICDKNGPSHNMKPYLFTIIKPLDKIHDRFAFKSSDKLEYKKTKF
jgi:hypothetical protein